MRKKFGRETALLSLPVLIIGGVAWWKTRTPAPYIGIEGLEVGAVSLERELFLTGAQARRRVHLAAVVVLRADYERMDEIRSFDEELRAPNGQVWRSSDKSLDVSFQIGNYRYPERGRRKQWRRFHWMVTIPSDAPTQNLTFSARLQGPDLAPRTVRFLARPAWKTRRPASLKLASVSWEAAPDNYPKRLNAIVRLRYTGSKPLFCGWNPISHQMPSQESWANTFTPRVSPNVAALMWGESQWIEDARGKLLLTWRRSQGGDMNYNSVNPMKPYLNAQGLIVVRYAIETRDFAKSAPLRFKTELGIVGDGILPVDLWIPNPVVQAAISSEKKAALN